MKLFVVPREGKGSYDYEDSPGDHVGAVMGG